MSQPPQTDQLPWGCVTSNAFFKYDHRRGQDVRYVLNEPSPLQSLGFWLDNAHRP